MAAVVAALEFLLRIWPTKKALSVLQPIQYALKSLAAIFVWFAGILDPVITSLNNIQPVIPSGTSTASPPTQPPAAS